MRSRRIAARDTGAPAEAEASRRAAPRRRSPPLCRTGLEVTVAELAGVLAEDLTGRATDVAQSAKRLLDEGAAALQEAFTPTATIETIGDLVSSLRGWPQPGRWRCSSADTATSMEEPWPSKAPWNRPSPQGPCRARRRGTPRPQPGRQGTRLVVELPLDPSRGS